MNAEKLQVKGVIFDLGQTLLVGQTRDIGAGQVVPRAGVVEALTELHAHDVRMGVVTGRDEVAARAILGHIGVLDLFNPDYILGYKSQRAVPVQKMRSEPIPGWRGDKLKMTRDVPYMGTKLEEIAEKPSPAPVQYLLREWGLEPPAAVFIGDDAMYDQMCARSAGVAFRLIRPMYQDNASLQEFVHAQLSF